jgi:hypothetical protein
MRLFAYREQGANFASGVPTGIPRKSTEQAEAATVRRRLERQAMPEAR